MEIRFRKHFVSKGEIKARVWYQRRARADGRECVSIYAKDYGDEPHLELIFPTAFNVQEQEHDYFHKGRVRIYSTDPLYDAALAMCK